MLSFRCGRNSIYKRKSDGFNAWRLDMAPKGKGRSYKISPKMSLRKSVVTGPRRILQVGRNDSCPCGSGEKYKNCCIKKAYHTKTGKRDE